jgi:outer membrane protein OmpA-like peptidoglycan-associated protein
VGILGLAFLHWAGAPGIGPGAQAQALNLPSGAELTREIEEPNARYALPTGRWTGEVLPTRDVEGRLLIRAWRLEAGGLTTLDLMSRLRDQLEVDGTEVLLECSARDCGGFDFRFNTRILPAPNMFVDLRDFRFLSLRLPGEDARFLSLLVSRAGENLYLQLIQVGPPSGEPPVVAATPDPAPIDPAPATGPLITTALLERGHVILSDLVFDSGSSTLADAAYPSLEALAAFLGADPARRVALVGHTDAVGGLEPNVALSRARAASVMTRLIERHGVDPAQVESNGMGYLAPVAPNTTPAGREANRRVEAVLLSLE